MLYFEEDETDAFGMESSVDEPVTDPVYFNSLHNVNDVHDQLSIPSQSKNKSKSNDLNGPVAATIQSTSDKVLATPAVRRIAMEHNITLSDVHGSGPKGRILKVDLLSLLRREKENFPPSSSVNKPEEQQFTVEDTSTSTPIRGIARQMVKTMTSSLSIPHMTFADEIIVNELMKVRDQLKPLAQVEDVRLTYLPFLIKATSIALQNHPILNARFDADQMTITYRKEHNIGIAIDSPKGLVVAVIKGCQNRSILSIAQRLNELQLKAKEGKLAEEDLNDSTFGLSNIGVIGGTYMNPVIVPPTVAIGYVFCIYYVF